MCFPFRSGWAGHLTAALLALLLAAPALAEDRPAENRPLEDRLGELRVCADPDNLPYSNERGEGFENRIAELVAADLGARLTYAWAPQRRGYVRKTLVAGTCDVLIGIPQADDRVLTTVPYYRSTYVLVARKEAGTVRSLDDPALHSLKVGVQLVGDDLAATPPGHVLARRGIMATGFPPFAGKDGPGEAVVEAVARGDIDVAVVWGPQAAFFARRQRVPLDLTVLKSPPDFAFLPFAFDISMGVRKQDAAFRRDLDGVLARHRQEIQDILRAYGVPLVPASGESPKGS